MLVLGITGGVGSGKSRVLAELQNKYGAFVIEADKLAHDLMEPGKIIYKAIVEEFGDSILMSEEPYAIDRKLLGEIVFNNNAKLEKLNSIVHPLVKQSILQSINEERNRQTIQLFVIEAALLIEDGYKDICDEIWYVWVSKETRINRLMKQRNYTREKSLSIMNNQSSDDYFERNTDYKIDNDKDYLYTSEQIKARLNKVL